MNKFDGASIVAFQKQLLVRATIGTFQSSCLLTATVEEQLFDIFLYQSVFRGLVFLHSAFSLSHPDVSVVCTGTVLLHLLSGRLFFQVHLSLGSSHSQSD